MKIDSFLVSLEKANLLASEKGGKKNLNGFPVVQRAVEAIIFIFLNQNGTT